MRGWRPSSRAAAAWFMCRGCSWSVVMAAVPPLPVDDVAKHLRECLPEYMVPARYIAMDALPLTGNGKVDRRALPELDGMRASSGQATVPQTATERRLAVLWADLLQLDRV